MPKKALIACDDPTVRRQLARIVSELGLVDLEAAGTAQARKCLEQNPDVVLVVENVQDKGREYMLDVLEDLPPRTERNRPKIICFRLPNAPGLGPRSNAHVECRIEDIDKESLRNTLAGLKVL